MIFRDPSFGDGFYVSPSDVKGAGDAVSAEVDRLDSDVSSSSVDQAFIDQWSSFRDEWKKFYDDKFTGFGWQLSASGNAYDTVQDYRKRVIDWRAKFASLGGAPTGVGITPPMEPWTSQLGKAGVGVALAVGAILVAVTVGPKLLKKK